ncbi:MAG: MutS-related protein, partial [Tannerellaceae bacterium]
FVVTGANMAGKSTFLRSVGVNMVLALTGSVVRATTFHFTPIQLFTSMRTTDNLAGGISYFHAELLRLKKLVDAASAGNPLFIILDEMLKGTNSTDKLNGSIRFLEKIRTLPLCGLIATHDLALGELSTKYPTEFHNICFEIEHTNEAISYDYKLKPGVSRNMNASILLKQMGLID